MAIVWYYHSATRAALVVLKLPKIDETSMFALKRQQCSVHWKLSSFVAMTNCRRLGLAVDVVVSHQSVISPTTNIVAVRPLGSTCHGDTPGSRPTAGAESRHPRNTLLSPIIHTMSLSTTVHLPLPDTCPIRHLSPHTKTTISNICTLARLIV